MTTEPKDPYTTVCFHCPEGPTRNDPARDSGLRGRLRRAHLRSERMSQIIKTWPAFMDAKKVAQIFSPHGCFARYYFTLGRGKPKQPITRIWFTWRGRILGSFTVEAVVCNDGSLPQLSRIDGEPSEWQIRKDAWVAVCTPGCDRLKERVFMSGFRGWRYFSLEEHRTNPESRVRL